VKLLITGGAGFIGSHLAETLLNKGHEVFIVDDLSTGSLDNLAGFEQNKNLHFLLDSVRNETLMDTLIKDVDQVFHLAAAVGVKWIIDNPLRSIQTNVLGTETVLRLACKHRKKVLLASTSEIYGKKKESPFKEEDDRLLGSTHISRWSYSNTKALDEFWALAYYREKKLPVVITRFFNTCGPRQTGQYGMVIPRFIKQALLGHPLTVYGDGTQSRCFAYVGDVIRGVLDLMEEPKAVGQVFNIGANESISILELAQRIKEMTASSSRIELVPYDEAYEEGFEDMPERTPCLEKIHETIGYQPRVDLAELLRLTINFFESEVA